MIATGKTTMASVAGRSKPPAAGIPCLTAPPSSLDVPDVLAPIRPWRGLVEIGFDALLELWRRCSGPGGCCSVQPLKLSLWPFGVQFVTTRFASVEDVSPGLDGLLEASFALEEEGTAVDGQRGV